MGGTWYIFCSLFCPAREACAYNPCQNDGECFPDERDLTDTMYTCDCTAGWSGVHCEGRYQTKSAKVVDFVVQMSSASRISKFHWNLEYGSYHYIRRPV